MYRRLRESLAYKVHEVWVDWIKYLFKSCTKNEDGSLTIPVHLVDRWTRQSECSYAKLEEHERLSDQKIADKYLVVIFQDE